jgi:HAE1 family hydrophobic/amphiphilic exporter-1
MKVAEFSVKRPVAVTMRIASIVLLGAICIGRLPIDLLPKVSIPTVVVITNWTNTAPEEMETQITKPVEEAVGSATNMYEIDSSSTQGNSSVRIQFNWGTDIGQASVEVLQLVNRAQQSFPQNQSNLQPPLVLKYDPSTLPIVVYGVTGEDNPVKLRMDLDNDVAPILESATGVASATDTGGIPRAIVVNADPVKLQAYGISMTTIASQIMSENNNLPAGIGRQGHTEYTVRVLGYFNNMDELRAMPLGTYNGQLVSLGMVADVSDTHQETRILTRLNGKPAAGISIVKQTVANTVDTAQNVADKMPDVKKLYPNLVFTKVYDQAHFIVQSIDDLKNTALIGGLMAIIILLMFLRNVRSTLVVALSIPISVISTFALLYFCGFTINTISLSGLALAVGLIVDDAVVVLENIFRHIERHKRRVFDASITGTTEIISAVVASTLTVMIVFIPLLMIQGQAGQMYTQFALVVIFSIAISLLDATTVVPMLASRLIHEDEVEEESHPELREQRGKKRSWLIKVFDWCGHKFDELDQSYHRALRWSLGHRWQVLIGAIAITAISCLLIPYIGSEMLPQTDSGNFTVNIKLPIGGAFTDTNAVMIQAEKTIMANKDVESIFSAAGSNLSIRGTATASIGYQGGAIVQLKDNRKNSTQQDITLLQKELAKIPGIRALVTPYDLVTQVLTGGATNMEVDVFGNDESATMVQAKKVLDQFRATQGIIGADLGVQEATPEIQWHIDRKKCEQMGIQFTDVANTIYAATAGAQANYYIENGYEYPIYVQTPENTRKTVAEMLNLPVSPSSSPTAAPTDTFPGLQPQGTGAGSAQQGTTQGGGGGQGSANLGGGLPTGGGGGGSAPSGNTQVLLKQVAYPVYAMAANQLTRINRQRYIAVTGSEQGRSESDIQSDLKEKLDTMDWPEGMRYDWGLQQKRRVQEFSGLTGAVLLAVGLIYMLLASQFESFIYPLVILTSVPLCITGVLLGLFLSGRAFGLTAFIGLLMLIGIAVKNGILLIDYTSQLRGRGMPRDEAILTAGPVRLRPILMTSSAAMLGMLPLALGIGKGSETQAPLATAVVGGLGTSTILTLFIVPIVYTLFDDWGRKIRKNPRDLAPPTAVEPNVADHEPMAIPAHFPDERPGEGAGHIG